MDALAILILAVLSIGLYRYVFTSFIFCGLDYSCRFSTEEAWEGEDVSLVETIHNNKFLPVQWLKAEIVSSRWLDFAGTRSVTAQDSRFVTSGYCLGGYQKTVRQWKVKCLKRGCYPINNVTLAGGCFLVSETRSIPREVNASLTVYPGTIDLDETLVPLSLAQSETAAARRLLDDPFLISGAREYTGREPVNRIHWPCTAKTGTLMVRENEFITEQSVLVVLNIETSEYEPFRTVDRDTVEFGIKAAATLFDRALSEGYPIGFASNGCIPGSIGKCIFTKSTGGGAHIRELMSLLACLELRISGEFEDFLDDIAADGSCSEILVLTSYLTDRLYRRIAALKKQDRHVGIILLGLAELECTPDTRTDVYRLKPPVGKAGV